jgi:hypothetical protein
MEGDTSKLRRPLVSFEDLDHDGHSEVIMQEWSHNGTAYNAAVQHYFSIDTDLQLWPALALETRSYLDIPPRDTWVVRTIRSMGHDTLAIHASLLLPDGKQRAIGEAVLIRNQTYGYHVGARRILEGKYGWALITTSGENEDSFVLEGYTFRY